MENSINSSMRKFPDFCSSSSRERTSDNSIEEESGWTMYFDDFFANNNNNNDNIENGSFCFDDHQNSSLVSDAASLVVKKSSDNEENVVGLSTQKSYSKKLSFKKRRTIGALVDDALEDTASSPVNSPKVYHLMNQFNKNPKQKDGINVLQEKGSASNSSHLVEERSGLGFTNVRENDSTELKKRGLCLVPLSMVVNYFG